MPALSKMLAVTKSISRKGINNRHPISKADVRLHIDGVIRKPTITANGKVLVERGVIKIPPLDTWVAN